MDEEKFVVYLHGENKKGTVWYRIILETTSKSKEQYQKISPVACLPSDKFGYIGSWVVIGDDIYWAGGALRHNVCKYLLKHNIHHDDFTSWDIVTTLTIPRQSPFLVATGRKIAVVAGYDCRINPTIDDNWRKAGEIYDLDKNTLSYLSSDRDEIEPHYRHTIQEETKQVVFFSRERGSILSLDASTGSIAVEHGQPANHNFYLSSELEDRDPPHGLEDCLSTRPLGIVVDCYPAVFHNRTLFYFTYEMRLYGYDVHLHKWFRSECLHRYLYPLSPEHDCYCHTPNNTLLLPLPNGNLLVIVRDGFGLFTMASLSVNKDDTSLGVTVKHIQNFRSDSPVFIPFQGKAIRLRILGQIPCKDESDLQRRPNGIPLIKSMLAL